MTEVPLAVQYGVGSVRVEGVTVNRLIPCAGAFASVLALLLLVGCGQVQAESRDSRAAGSAAPDATATVSVIDVGKGDCILVQVGGSAVLIDAGYTDTADDVLSFLEERGVDRLDALVVTHYDRDHIGGVGPIGEAIPIAKVFLPGYEGGDKNYRSLMAALDRLGSPMQPVTETVHLALGAADMAVYPSAVTYVPDANGDEGNDNDLSLVVSLVAGDDSYLFAGDLEEAGIEAYLENPRGHFDVLKMPHHGQKDKGNEDLLASVQPEIALITDSADDPADKKTLKLLQKMGADTYASGTCGTIVVRGDGAGHYDVSCLGES